MPLLLTCGAIYPRDLSRVDGTSFVYKHVSESFFHLSQHLTKEFAGTQYLRMHVDSDASSHALIYPYFTCTLLSLLQESPNLSTPTIKKILHCTSKAVKEFHDKNWIHIGQSDTRLEA